MYLNKTTFVPSKKLTLKNYKASDLVRLIISPAIGVLLYIIISRMRRSAFTSPVGMEKLSPRTVGSFVGMRSEVVALRLDKVGRRVQGA